MDNLKEKIARAIGGVYDGYADPVDTPTNWSRAQEAAAAILRAIEEAGYAVVPKELPEAPGTRYSAGDYSRRNWEAAMTDLRPLNLEEPRG